MRIGPRPVRRSGAPGEPIVPQRRRGSKPRPRRLEGGRGIGQDGGVPGALRERLLRARSRAPRGYWAARSRAAELAAGFHARWIARRIARALRGQRRVRFAQIGSNDGVRGDPLRALVLGHAEWTGVFAEPLPSLFARLRRHYPAEPRLHFEPVAVARQPGRRRVYALSPDAPRALGGTLPSWYDQLGSLDPEHGVRQLGERIRPLLVAHEVECVRLDELLARGGLDGLDLLHVDAEGADAEILEQLDLDASPPRVVLYEHAHLPPPVRRAASARLRAAGYTLTRHGGDTLAVRPGARR
jgi:FkbM family methyltransferase